ncbi:MAG: hypothetical protein C5B54_11375 [Acidobacteria bacterium]|nr:MAG: hypothetical protein C5B54_11375 [Acidobacteriota bacterium]
MANETGLSSVTGSVPKLWRVKALKARYAESKVWKLCINGVEGDPNVKGSITKMGDTVHFQIFPVLTVGNISTSDGSFTNQVVTPTDKTITINLWKSVNVDLVDIAGIQSVLDWEAEFADAFGKAISQQQDVDVLNLFQSQSWTNTNTPQNVPLSDGLVLLAQRTLDDTKIPKEDRHWALSPVAEADLLALDKFSLANTTGFTKGLQVEGGRITGLYGTDVTVTPIVNNTNNVRFNALFHKEAIGIVMQKNFTMEKFARTKFSQPYAGSALYGVAQLRSDHAYVVGTAA